MLQRGKILKRKKKKKKKLKRTFQKLEKKQILSKNKKRNENYNSELFGC